MSENIQMSENINTAMDISTEMDNTNVNINVFDDYIENMIDYNVENTVEDDKITVKDNKITHKRKYSEKGILEYYTYFNEIASIPLEEVTEDVSKRILFYYDIVLLNQIIENKHTVLIYIKSNEKIYNDVGFSLLDNMFSLYVLCLNKNNCNILFSNEHIKYFIKLFSVTKFDINEIIFFYFKQDFDLLLLSGYDINKLSKYRNNKSHDISFNCMSILGYFIFSSFQTFFHLNNPAKFKFLYALLPSIFHYLYDIGCDFKQINYFPDNNIMSISAYVLILMINLYNNKNKLIVEKNSNIETIEKCINDDLKKKYIFDKNTFNLIKNINYACDDDFYSSLTPEQQPFKENHKKYKSNINSPNNLNTYIIHYCMIKKLYIKIVNINNNIYGIDTILNLMNWIFNIIIRLPDSLSSIIVHIETLISINNINNKNIRNLYELIKSDIIPLQLKNYIMLNYCQIINDYEKSLEISSSETQL